jgi:hypothetical protein
MPVPITGLYAALMFLIVLWLGFQVGSTRNRTRISILHGDDIDLAEKIRRHANFTENVPLVLILMTVVELNGGAPTLLHGCGITLVAARIAHPLGLHHDNIRHPLRALGALGTLLVTLVLAATAALQFLSA